ncbi:MAG: hypothetical protein IFJ96_04455, partial [Acidobacteria bacterium]|nr:hypothetical protein [Candidatus Sulfomarinibacter sp. MAG AM2]
MADANPVLTGDGQPAGPGPHDSYLNHGKGILSWLFTLDHKRIGIMYLAAILSSFFL